ncbi:MAG: hypothetical protein RLY86_1207 [Pseudomonadota bacterium]
MWGKGLVFGATMAAAGALSVAIAAGGAMAQTAPGQATPPEFETLAKPAAGHTLSAATVTAGLDAPWDMQFMPDGRILVTERTGKLRIVKDGALLPEPMQGLPVIEEVGQGGLLSIALHPDYATNRQVYLCFAERDPEARGHRTAIARFTDEGTRFTGGEVIFRGATVSSRHHFGCRMQFGPQDGKLYFTIGDRGEQDRAQDPAQPTGAVLRINDDGSIPDDNPFAGKAGHHPARFTLGNRNPQGLAFEPGTGALWANEHGPQGGDEVNIIRAGVNYGWPVITYGRTYGLGLKIGEGTARDGMAQPEVYFVPSLALSDMVFVQGDSLPNYRGDLVMALLAGGIVRLDVQDGRVIAGERLLEDELERTRDLTQGPDGALYALIDAPAPDGRLVRITGK